jgi:hypothetical protein
MSRQPTGNKKPRIDRYPCVFRDAFIRETIDPQVSLLWKERWPPPVPFGDLRRIWKYEHCRFLSPGGSGLCRFPREDCGLAFFTAVQHALAPTVTTNPVGYYRRLARSMAIDRADRRPLEREIGPRDGGSTGRGHREGPRGVGPLDGPAPVLLARDQGVSGEEPGVHGPRTRPIRVGELLGSLDLGSHQGPPTNGGTRRK